MTWSAVDKRKIGGLTLFQIIKEYETYPEQYTITNTENPHLEEDVYTFEDNPQELAFA